MTHIIPDSENIAKEALTHRGVKIVYAPMNQATSLARMTSGGKSRIDLNVLHTADIGSFLKRFNLFRLNTVGVNYIG